jgi:hypothetical protein
VWVKVDRDVTPDVAKRFGVSAYPTLLTVGDDMEKVHRFQGFKKPAEFKAQLEEALRRWKLYRAGEEWDKPEPRPATICDEGTVESFPAPSEEVPSGLAFLDDALWVAQQGELFRLDARSEVAARHVIPRTVRDLCTDGKLLYGMEYGWTAGDPIHVIDPATGKTTRRIVTAANAENRAKGAAGVAWRDGRLWVLAGMRGVLSEVDPATGDVTRTLQAEARWLSCLAFDGTHFVAGSREALYWIDPETGKTVRKVLVNYPVRAVAFHDGAYYVMEQPVFGHDVKHQRVRIWPERMLVYKLTLKKK